MLFIGLFVAGSFLHFRHLILPGKATPTKNISKSKKSADQRKHKGGQPKHFPPRQKAGPVGNPTHSTQEQNESEPEPVAEVPKPETPPQSEVEQPVRVPKPTFIKPATPLRVVATTPPVAAPKLDRDAKKRRAQRLQAIARCLKLQQAAIGKKIELDLSSFMILARTVNVQVMFVPERRDESKEMCIDYNANMFSFFSVRLE